MSNAIRENSQPKVESDHKDHSRPEAPNDGKAFGSLQHEFHKLMQEADSKQVFEFASKEKCLGEAMSPAVQAILNKFEIVEHGDKGVPNPDRNFESDGRFDKSVHYDGFAGESPDTKLLIRELENNPQRPIETSIHDTPPEKITAKNTEESHQNDQAKQPSIGIPNWMLNFMN